MLKVIKRDGTIVNFETDKITHAITKAMDETELGVDFPLVLKIAREIEGKYNYDGVRGSIPSVEMIQDDVEIELMKTRPDVAKRYILYREERSKLRSQGWEMTELQRDIYEQKYRYNNESFDEFLERVSGGNQFIKKAIRDKKFLPAGRILAGRGMNINGRNVTLSNCYVLPKVEDNIESIFDTAKHLARTFSYGGGVGFNISNLRPRDSKVNNSAKSTTGSVSFMDLYSLVTGLIGQNARRK